MSGGITTSSKLVALLAETVPSMSHVALLSDSTEPLNVQVVAEMREGARTLKLKLDVHSAGNAGDLDRALASIDAGGARGLVVTSAPFLFTQRARIADFAARRRLPAIQPSRQFVDAGGLMAYGASLDDSYRRAADYVDRILKGAKPADLPVEQPTHFDEYDGTVTVLIDSFEGKRLNSPNDVVVHPDGGIWFTDPAYGIEGNYVGNAAKSELPERVYRLDPKTGKTQVVADEPAKPNGLCFSPDHSSLYVADSKFPPKEIFVYDVIEQTRLSKARVFVKEVAGLADGIRCDVHGNLWASAGWKEPGSNGVHVYAPDGVLIGKIRLPEVCANLCFGGPKRNRLFMTASQSLYAVYVNTQGAQVV